MGRQVALTSKEAYKAILPTLGSRQQEVLGALDTLGEASNYQLSLYLSLDINQVTGRITELRKKGLVESSSVTPGRYNIRNQVWRVVEDPVPPEPVPEQLTLIEMDCGE